MYNLLNINLTFVKNLISLCIIATVISGCYNDNFNEIVKEEKNSVEPVINPVPGNSGIITILGVTTASVQITWDRATDDTTLQENLEYRVYLSSANNIFSVGSAEANGTLSMDWTIDTISFDVSGLAQSTTYFFNVIVMDGGGKKSAYATVSATTASAPGSTVFLYSAGSQNGNLGGRAGADAFCAANVPGTLTCPHVRAFLGVSGADRVADMPANYGLPAGNPVKGANKIKIANDWSDLLDGNIAKKIRDAGMPNNHWWSGSDKNGNLEDNCAGFTTGSSSIDGMSGHGNFTNKDWIAKQTKKCNNSQTVLCACW